jgi:hypothetical protein
MPSNKIDELTIAKVRKAYVNGEGTLPELAKRFGIGERTIKRYSSEGDWESLKSARGTVVDGALRDRLRVAPGEFNPDALLLSAIQDLSAASASVVIASHRVRVAGSSGDRSV